MCRKITIIFLMLLITTVANSAPMERLTSQWQVKCTNQKTRFTITSKSTSNKAGQNDHLLYVSGSKTPLNLGKALHARSNLESEVKSVCNQLPVFDVGNDNILIWLRQDDRPAYDLLTLVLYNLKLKRAVSRLENIGRVKAASTEALYVRKVADGFEVKLIKQWVKEPGVKAKEYPVEAWMHVSISEKRISREWIETNRDQ